MPARAGMIQKRKGRINAPLTNVISSAMSYSPSPNETSTIGAGGLNYRIRNGNGCTSAAIVTKNFSQYFIMQKKDELSSALFQKL